MASLDWDSMACGVVRMATRARDCYGECCWNNYKLKLQIENYETKFNSLFRTITSNCRWHQIITWDIVQNCALVASLILVLLIAWTLLDSLTILFMLPIGSLKLENLRKARTLSTTDSIKCSIKALSLSPWFDTPHHAHTFDGLHCCHQHTFQLVCGMEHPSRRRASSVWIPSKCN